MLLIDDSSNVCPMRLFISLWSTLLRALAGFDPCLLPYFSTGPREDANNPTSREPLSFTTYVISHQPSFFCARCSHDPPLTNVTIDVAQYIELA
jgi:hypothetical protein